MPNHIHFVIEPTIEGSLSKLMLRLTLAYTWYFNKKYKGVGHVWQGRYKSSLLDKENYFIWCGLYNELNPVRAKIVEKPEDWPWSTFHFYAFGTIGSLPEGIIDYDPYYLELGDTPEKRQKRYLENMTDVVKKEFLKDIRWKLDEGVFGKSNFIQQMRERFKIKSLKSRGRPRES